MRKISVLLAVVLCLGLLASCENSLKDNIGKNVGDIVQGDYLKNAEAALTSGDYTNANKYYNDLLARDPNNKDAKFGVAITQLILAATETQQNLGIQSLASKQISSLSSIQSVLSSFKGGSDSVINVPAARKGLSSMAMAAVEEPKQFSDYQNAVKPLIVKMRASQALVRELESTDFEYIITIQSGQEGSQEQKLIINGADACIVDMLLSYLIAPLDLLTAYNLDLDYSVCFSSDGVPQIAAILGTTKFLALNTGAIDGKATMADAYNKYLSLITTAKKMLTLLAAQPDDSTGYLIPKPSAEEAAQITSSLDQAQTMITEPYTEPDSGMVIDIKKFFLNPMADIKAFLPNHTILNNELTVDDPLTFPDPTFNGLFPDMTNTAWQNMGN
jgi:hypothetical protein